MGSLHENIQELLDENGVMLVTMCKDLGFSTNILTELRTGRKKDITAGKAKKIAEYFNVSVDRVLYGKDAEKEKMPATEVTGTKRKYAIHILENATEEEVADYLSYMEWRRSKKMEGEK